MIRRGRRRFLAATATALAVPIGRASQSQPSSALCALIGLDPSHARHLARHYLASAGAQCDAHAACTDAFLSGLCQEGLDAVTVARALDRRIRADFACERVVRVDGWLLSLTECRLCVLQAGMAGA